MGRPVVHFEIGCRDAKKTQEFYTKMFGWNITEAGPAAMIARTRPDGSRMSQKPSPPRRVMCG